MYDALVLSSLCRTFIPRIQQVYHFRDANDSSICRTKSTRLFHEVSTVSRPAFAGFGRKIVDIHSHPPMRCTYHNCNIRRRGSPMTEYAFKRYPFQQIRHRYVHAIYRFRADLPGLLMKRGMTLVALSDETMYD